MYFKNKNNNQLAVIVDDILIQYYLNDNTWIAISDEEFQQLHQDNTLIAQSITNDQ